VSAVSRKLQIQFSNSAKEIVVASVSEAIHSLRQGNLTPQQARLFPPNYLQDSWLDYLYWDTELDP